MDAIHFAEFVMAKEKKDRTETIHVARHRQFCLPLDMGAVVGTLS